MWIPQYQYYTSDIYRHWHGGKYRQFYNGNGCVVVDSEDPDIIAIAENADNAGVKAMQKLIDKTRKEISDI